MQPGEDHGEEEEHTVTDFLSVTESHALLFILLANNILHTLNQRLQFQGNIGIV